MLKAIVTLTLGFLAFATTAQAETVRLAHRNLSADDREVIVDIKDACGLKAVSVVTAGGTFWVNELTVAYRADRVTRDRFVVNKVNSSGWLALKKDNLCVRRFYVNVESSGSDMGNATITVFGQR